MDPQSIVASCERRLVCDVLYCILDSTIQFEIGHFLTNVRGSIAVTSPADECGTGTGIPQATEGLLCRRSASKFARGTAGESSDDARAS